CQARPARLRNGAISPNGCISIWTTAWSPTGSSFNTLSQLPSPPACAQRLAASPRYGRQAAGPPRSRRPPGGPRLSPLGPQRRPWPDSGPGAGAPPPAAPALYPHGLPSPTLPAPPRSPTAPEG